MSIHIRTYNIKDKKECLESFKSNVPFYFADLEINEFEYFLDRLVKGIPKTEFYVIFNQIKIIGCGGFGDKDNQNKISLTWGHIHKNEHKKGFGEYLLNYRLNKIKNLYPLFPITVETTQYSYGFYKKYGFKILKITENYYSDGLHKYEMVLNIA